mgnify:FL=1
MKITVQLARTFLDNFEGRDFLDNKGSIAEDKIDQISDEIDSFTSGELDYFQTGLLLTFIERELKRETE